MTNALYTVLETDIEMVKGLPMVAMLSGFSDSGSCIAQLSEHFYSQLDSDLLVSFSNDEFLDYRSRRPTIFFEKDHIESYDAPSLGIYLMLDETKRPFLLLEGYEPDFRWEAFARSIVELTKEFEVSSFTWVHSIPFPIPHTRPIGVTVSGNRGDMISKYSEWKPQTQAPGNILHLIEHRLTAAGVALTGFVFLVPHYLGDNEVPQVALKAIELISAASGLVIPSDEIRDQGSKFLAKLDSQIAENADLAKMIATLEQGYASNDFGPSRAPIAKPKTDVPSADEIAAELENYLATRRNSGDENAGDSETD